MSKETLILRNRYLNLETTISVYPTLRTMRAAFARCIRRHSVPCPDSGPCDAGVVTALDDPKPGQPRRAWVFLSLESTDILLCADHEFNHLSRDVALLVDKASHLKFIEPEDYYREEFEVEFATRLSRIFFLWHRFQFRLDVIPPSVISYYEPVRADFLEAANDTSDLRTRHRD